MRADLHPAPTDTSAPPLALRTREAAEALGISERTLQGLTAAGDIPHVKLGRAVLFPVRELRNWLTSRATPANGDTPDTMGGGR